MKNIYPNLNKVELLTNKYYEIKEIIYGLGYIKESEWQNKINFDTLIETEFLKECAWVILSTGMKETIIRKYFPNLSNVFYNWESSNLISNNKTVCKKKALRIFNHKQKISAIINISTIVQKEGFHNIKNKICEGGIDYLKSFYFIGPITCYHLAKNIGLDVVKPDRHLVRIAKALKYKDPFTMCSELSKMTGDKLSVVDIILWRYASINKNYLESFQF
jgi:hypothetical protein